MSETLIFLSSHRRHKKVADRIIGAINAGRGVELFSFDRGTIDHPIYSHPAIEQRSLGPVRDGASFGRLISIARATWILSRAARRIRAGHTIVLVNTFELLVISWLCGLTRYPTVYDVADINPLLLSNSLVGRFARWMERKLLPDVGLVVVTSPWFYWGYLATWQRLRRPAALIENRVRVNPLDVGKQPSFGKRIAWNGLLRCQLSGRVLLACLTSAPSHLRLSLHGSLDRLGHLSQQLLACPNCEFTGNYDVVSLPGLLSDSSFVWAVDYSERENSKWLLPNRLYEGIAAGVPLIAAEGSATAEIVRYYDLGIVLQECSCKELLGALQACTEKDYLHWVGKVNEIRDRAYRGNEWRRVLGADVEWNSIDKLPQRVDPSVVLRRIAG